MMNELRSKANRSEEQGANGCGAIWECTKQDGDKKNILNKETEAKLYWQAIVPLFLCL